MTTIVTLEDYQDAVASCIGWCAICRDFTRDNTEPDAEDYDCPLCGGHDVVGAENALIMRMIDFDDKGEEGEEGEEKEEKDN